MISLSKHGTWCDALMIQAVAESLKEQIYIVSLVKFRTGDFDRTTSFIIAATKNNIHIYVHFAGTIIK